MPWHFTGQVWGRWLPAGVFGEEPGWAAPVFILMFINIHHYFTESLIWEDQEPGSSPRIIRALVAALRAARS